VVLCCKKSILEYFLSLSLKKFLALTPFFRRTGTSVQVGGKFFQKFMCHLGLILKLRDGEIGCLIFENY